MIAMRTRLTARFQTRRGSLQRQWQRAMVRLLLIMLLAGAGSVAGTTYLVVSASGIAHRLETEARVFAQLRQDVVTGSIFLSGGTGSSAGGVTTMHELDVALARSFTRAHAAALSSQGRVLLTNAQSSWSSAVTKIQAIAPEAPADTRGLIVGQVLSVEAPLVLAQLDRASAAGRTEARAELEQDKVTAAFALAGLVVLTLLGLAMVTRLGRRLTRQVLKPVGLLRASADRFAEGDLDHRVALSGDDEIGRLAESFNAMADAIAGSQQRLTVEANRDPLTGLANRAGFRSKSLAALTRPDRRKGEQALLFIDLDDFKDVNDLLGHRAGDDLLRVVAGRLVEEVRPGDLVARLGGDEFAVHLDDVPSPHAAFALAERLVAAVREPALVLGHTVRVGATIGLAMVHDSSDLDQLMQEADMAMYAAKSQGKNRVECYDPSLRQALVEHHTLRADIGLAADRDELVLEYQPLVDLTSGTLKGVEALVRWQHPTRGLLPPSAFIELAEQAGVMPDVGKWVLETALTQVGNWQRRYHRPDFGVAVNVSAFQLTDDFVPAVDAALRATWMRPETLTLEVTESTMVDESSSVPRVLRALQALGVRVALDDFGTGYASIAHLRILPIDVLKIDRSFVANAREDTRGEVLLGGLVKLGAHLGLNVIPEGIELPEDLRRLQRMGCVQGQGFLFSRPVPAAELEEWLVGSTTQMAGGMPQSAELPVPRSPAVCEIAGSLPKGEIGIAHAGQS